MCVWRGTEIPQEIKDHPQYEWHQFFKLPFSDPNTKKLVSEYWTGLTDDKKVEGLEATNVKYFK